MQNNKEQTILTGQNNLAVTCCHTCKKEKDKHEKSHEQLKKKASQSFENKSRQMQIRDIPYVQLR